MGSLLLIYDEPYISVLRDFLDTVMKLVWFEGDEGFGLYIFC